MIIKKTMSICCVIILLVGLCACAKQDDKATGKSTADEVIYWYINAVENNDVSAVVGLHHPQQIEMLSKETDLDINELLVSNDSYFAKYRGVYVEDYVISEIITSDIGLYMTAVEYTEKYDLVVTEDYMAVLSIKHSSTTEDNEPIKRNVYVFCVDGLWYLYSIR